MPLQRQQKQWSDRKKWVEEPFIKSYLFVHIKEHEQTEVLMTKGIARFIYFSGKIATLPDRQLNELKLLLASPYELEITEEDLQPGEIIVIKGRSFKRPKRRNYIVSIAKTTCFTFRKFRIFHNCTCFSIINRQIFSR